MKCVEKCDCSGIAATETESNQGRYFYTKIKAILLKFLYQNIKVEWHECLKIKDYSCSSSVT